MSYHHPSPGSASAAMPPTLLWVDESLACACGEPVVVEGVLDLEYDELWDRMVVVCRECLADVGVLPPDVVRPLGSY